MLIIRKEQMEAMAEAMRFRFVTRSIVFLENNAPAWCQDKDAAERKQFADDMVKFAQANKVLSEVNIQRLMVWKIEHRFPIPLTEYMESTLNNESMSEEQRLERFLQAITTDKGLVKITLD
jgi:hypothetical protein